MIINYLNGINQILDDCKTSPIFFIRERLYKGRPGEHLGLKHYHNLITELTHEIIDYPVEDTYFIHNKAEFELITTSVTEALEALPYLLEKDRDSDNINNLLHHFEVELFKLIEFIDKARDFTGSIDIDLGHLKIQDLK